MKSVAGGSSSAGDEAMTKPRLILPEERGWVKRRRGQIPLPAEGRLALRAADGGVEVSEHVPRVDRAERVDENVAPGQCEGAGEVDGEDADGSIFFGHK